jgi:hypothetical protein
MNNRTEQDRIAVILTRELAQNMMLVGYESSSSRILAKDGALEFSGFSGKLVMQATGQMTLSVAGIDVFDSSDGFDTVSDIDGLVERFMRLNSELMEVYTQQVLSGD